VIVDVIAVRMVHPAVDKIIDVVAVRHGSVPTAWTMHMAAFSLDLVRRLAAVRVIRRNTDQMRHGLSAFIMKQASAFEPVDVVAVSHGD
jgi:hypothetical protein